MMIKKSAMVLFVVCLFISLSVMSVGAIDFSCKDLTLTVPDGFTEVTTIFPDMVRQWDKGEDFSVSVISESNKDYKFIYADCSEEKLESIAGGKDSGKTAENVTVNGLKGVKTYEETEECIYIDYHFSTVDDYFSIKFYVYDEDYMGYVDEILNTVNIDCEIVENSFSFYTDFIILAVYILGITAVASIALERKKKKSA